MFGFSFNKFLFTALIIAAVIYGFRWIGQMQKRNEQRVRNGSSARKPGGSAASNRQRATSQADDGDIETMIECRVCSSYVAASGARSCGRPDCPYSG